MYCVFFPNAVQFFACLCFKENLVIPTFHAISTEFDISVPSIRHGHGWRHYYSLRTISSNGSQYSNLNNASESVKGLLGDKSWLGETCVGAKNAV